MKLTRAQLQGRKDKAVRFTRDVLSDPDRADEIEAESLDDYAEGRKVKLINSSNRRNAIMARSTKTKADLEAEVADLQDENQSLQDQLDAVADIVAPADDDEDDDDSDSDDDGDGETLLALGAGPAGAIRSRREADLGARSAWPSPKRRVHQRYTELRRPLTRWKIRRLHWR